MEKNQILWDIVVGENDDGVLVGLVGDVERVGGRRRIDHRHVATAAQRSLKLKCFKQYYNTFYGKLLLPS